MGEQEQNDQIATQENNSPAANGTVTDGADTPVDNHNNNNNNNKDQPGFKGNEDRKIFVGGIAYDVTNDDLSNHFSQYGEVSQAQVKFDRTTGRSRGFAFVEFATVEACKSALNHREQLIKNKQCEIKPAKSRENKKVFVGGLPADHPEEELRKHFEQYGKVEDIEWPFDKQTKARRNFAFIVFEEEDAADRAASISKQTFGSRECDVKKAVPQSKRTNFMMNMRGGPMGGMGRGMYGGAGMRSGHAMTAMHNTATQWFNSGWPQAAMHNGPAMATAWNTHAATTGGAGTGAWGDWYAAIGGNGAAATANAFHYAQQANNGANAFGTFASNGYDYGATQAGASGGMNRQPQNGATATPNRY